MGLFFKTKGVSKMELTQEQKAKRYDVLEKALYDFLLRKIADAKYDDSEVKTYQVLDEWMSNVDCSDLLPEDVYQLFDVILDEGFENYYGERASTLPYLKKKYQEFQKKIGG